jgi:hypothetical protein
VGDAAYIHLEIEALHRRASMTGIKRSPRSALC